LLLTILTPIPASAAPPDDAYVAGYAAAVLEREFNLPAPSLRVRGGVLDRTDRRSHYRPHTSGNLVHLRRNARRGLCPACHVSRLV